MLAITSPEVLNKSIGQLTKSAHHMLHMVYYLFSLSQATVPAFDTCILRHTTVSGSNSTTVDHSRLLPSLITRQLDISQQRQGKKTFRSTRQRAPPAPEQTLPSILIKLSSMATRGR